MDSIDYVKLARSDRPVRVVAPDDAEKPGLRRVALALLREVMRALSNVRSPFVTDDVVQRSEGVVDVAQPSNDTFEDVFTTQEKAALRGELFLNRELVGVDLSGADLRGARFERTVLVRCNLAGADLRSAHFIFCDLRSVVLADSLFGDNRFDGTMLVEAVGLNAENRALIERGGGSFQHARASLR